MLILLSMWTNADFLTDIKPGIYQDEIGKVAILNRDAEIWIKMDLGELDVDIRIIKDLAGQLKKLCTKSTIGNVNFKKNCEDTIAIGNTMISNLQKDYDNLMTRREKRSVDWMDLGVKIVFGTIDYFNKESMKDKLETIEKSDETQKKFNFEFTKLIVKTVSQLNDTVEVINHHANLLESMRTDIEVLKNNSRNYDLEVQSGFVFSGISSQFNAIYFATDNKIREIHQSIIDLQSNVLNTKIVTLDNLIEGLKQIKIVDESLNLPINLESPDFETLRKLTRYVVMMKGTNLIIVYSIPLKEDNFGLVQKFFSIPTLEDETAKFLDISNGYIISDKSLDRYVVWERELFRENCINVNRIFYC